MLASKQPPYRPSPIGELSDRSNRELNVSKLLTAMSTLRMDFGLTEDGVLDISDRDGVLLALHLFQVMAGFRSLGDWRHLATKLQGGRGEGIILFPFFKNGLRTI